jgi:hypothetical protein
MAARQICAMGAAYSKFVIWVSPEGLLLAFGRGTGGKPRSERAMTLVSFQQWTEF